MGCSAGLCFTVPSELLNHELAQRLVPKIHLPRVPNSAQASRRIWGHPDDSPNFITACNASLQMGIHANVLMENTGLWDPWTNASLEEAFGEMKRRFNLAESDEHDAFLGALLERNLTYEDGRYVWPRGVRSALVYWPVPG